MNAADVIRRLHEHRLWTNERMIDACAALSDTDRRKPFPMGPGSVWGTLVHVYGAEMVWLGALGAVTARPFPGDSTFKSLDDLLIAWNDLHEQWRRYLAKLDDRELSRPVTRTNLKGVTTTTAASDVLLHVCTHSMYHVAQLMNMLRHLGVSPLPETNLITMAREQWNHAG